MNRRLPILTLVFRADRRVEDATDSGPISALAAVADGTALPLMVEDDDLVVGDLKSF